MTGERDNADTSTADDWKKRLPALCEWYRPEDIFNMDETGMHYDQQKFSYQRRTVLVETIQGVDYSSTNCQFDG